MGFIFLDSGNFEWWPFASSALALVVGGGIVAWLQHRSRRQDDETRQARDSIQGEFNKLNLGLAVEREERATAINNEAEARRKECAALGKDISGIREAFNYYCGSTGKEKPRFGGGSSER